MSDKPPPPPLSLVSNFVASEYIYAFTQNLNDPYDHTERADTLASMRRAATQARLPDYKLLEETMGISIYMRTGHDVLRFNVATSPDEEVQGEFVQTDADMDFRKLKRARNKLQRITDKAGFGNDVFFGVDRRDKTIFYDITSKDVFFDFDDFVQSNKELFQPILRLQRQETNIAATDAQNAVAASITYDDEEQTPLPETDPKSMGVTIGGKAPDAERSNNRSHLSLVKSFEPMANGYEYKLTPKIIIDPERSQMDKLSTHVPDYPAFKKRTITEKTMMQIRRAMSTAEAEDYYLNDGPNGIDAWFKTPQDLAVAYAAISPSVPIQLDFMHCSRNASPMKMSKKAKALQRIFDAADKNIKVRFSVDKERHVIQADMDSTDDFIRVQGLSRRLERSNSQFRRLIELN